VVTWQSGDRRELSPPLCCDEFNLSRNQKISKVLLDAMRHLLARRLDRRRQ
jgi:hypothetical protein